MKRMMQFTAALALSMAVGACAGDNTANENEAMTPGTETGANATAGTSGTADANVDRDFLHEHLAMGEAEIALGQLAQEKGTHADVKEYGAMMVRDHRMAGEELKQVATQVNAAAEPNATNDHRDDHMDALEELRGLSGREFDRKYIDRMVQDHEKGVRDLESKVEGNSNPQVQQWATKTLPKMREHLERARAIQQTLERAGEGANR